MLVKLNLDGSVDIHLEKDELTLLVEFMSLPEVRENTVHMEAEIKKPE